MATQAVVANVVRNSEAAASAKRDARESKALQQVQALKEEHGINGGDKPEAVEALRDTSEAIWGAVDDEYDMTLDMRRKGCP